MTDSDLISWLQFHYNQEQRRIELIRLVQKRQASRFWRIKQKVKGWFGK